MERPEIELIKASREAAKQAAPGDNVNKYMRWTLYMAGKYRRRGLAYGIAWEDLQGVALLALADANEEYPKSSAAANSIPFRAYLTRVIQNRFEDLFRKASLVHLSSPAAWNQLFQLRNIMDEARQKQGKHYIPESDLAKDLGWPVERVEKCLKLARMVDDHVSIDAPLYEDESNSELFESVHEDPTDIESEAVNHIALEQEKEWLIQATADLPPLARVSIALTFGLSMPDEIPRPTVEQVIRTAIGHSANTKLGLAKLREAREHEKGDMPDLAPGRRTFAHGGCWSGETITSKKGQHWAYDIWRRYTSEQESRAFTGY